MKTVTIDKTIHIVTYSCSNITLCNKKIPANAVFVERKSPWESNCNKCKKIISPVR